jgi:hypothetical protein
MIQVARHDANAQPLNSHRCQPDRFGPTVDDALDHAINQKLDAALESAPEAARDRDLFYKELLRFFEVYGCLPDFQLRADLNR